MPPETFRFGSVIVELHDGYTRTIFPCGSEASALHAEQPGPLTTAIECGYESAKELNRDHDLTHSILANWLGLPWSPTLHDVAIGAKVGELHLIEEAAVTALQRYANAVGVDLIEAARRTSA